MRWNVRQMAAIVGLLAMVGVLGSAGALWAVQLPPQVLPSGFESTDSLLRDVDRAERGAALLGVDRREQPVS